MLILTDAGTDKLQLVTSTAAAVDVHADWADMNPAASPIVVTPGRTSTAISSGATTDIVAKPATNFTRNVKALTIRNKDASLSVDVTVLYNANGTTFEMHKTTLVPGAMLEFVEGVGFFVLSANVSNLKNFSAAGQSGGGFTSDTYITGSSIAVPANLPLAGTTYHLVVMMTKSAAGTATPTFNLRYGTLGAVGDTSRGQLAFTVLTTTAADAARWDFICYFRTVGSGTSAVIQSNGVLINNLATTGFSGTTPIKSVDVTSGGFDSTVANSFIGMSFNGGASSTATITQARAELIA